MRAGVELCGAGHPARGNDVEPIPSSRHRDRAFARCAGRMARATYVFQFFLTTRVSAVSSFLVGARLPVTS